MIGLERINSAERPRLFPQTVGMWIPTKEEGEVGVLTIPG